MKSEAPKPVIAITGGTGFIGSHVTALLEKAGYAPVQLTPLGVPGPSVYWELEWDSERTARAIAGVNVLIHLAAYIPADLNDPSEGAKCMALNALGTANLVKAAKAAGVTQLIHSSTAALYAPGHEICDEHTPLFPKRAASYLASKLAAEIYVKDASHNSDLVCSTLRLASVYGPGMNKQGLVPRCVQTLKSGRSFVVADGNRYQTDLIFVGDVARAFVSCVGKTAGGVYNIGSGKLTTPYELALCVAAMLGVDASLVSIAPSNGGPPPACPGRLNLSAAVSELDFSPRDLRKGLELYFESLK